jgi:hypothetical protein
MELPVVEALFLQMSPGDLEAARAAELGMQTRDRLAVETLEKKNELESMVYDLRGKLKAQYRCYRKDEDAAELGEKLDFAEKWLYGEGTARTLEEYSAKVLDLKAEFEPLLSRYLHYQAIPTLLRNLGITADSSMAEAYTPNAHVTETEVTKILDLVTATHDWISLVQDIYRAINPILDFPIPLSEFAQREKALHELTRAVMDRPPA